MPRTVDVGDAKAQFSKLIARAETGDDVMIVRDGVPVARIVPVVRPTSKIIALMRKERAQRLQVTAADIRASKEQGRA
ncbi:MAG: type II toxin-antitoxin system prevent-host-death family antitoxin [Rhodospirillaceae bacterium]|nr:type II toxin-antitoxin system prevent-host-death family antitoxin [Rhodospirillaceae bacterium]